MIGFGFGFGFNTLGTLLNYNWAEQPEVLFYGLVSEISGGQMPNKVTGATDYLTVAGSAGSETYQTPNTAPYISADTDYIWFKTDASQRTTTTAELIGYDFPRTIVKYADSSPYAIEAIMILKAGETLSTSKENAMRDAFDLSVWWSNVLSAHGNVKGNRGIGQSAWTPEVIFNPGTLSNLVLWLKADAGVTVTGAGVSEWLDYSGNDNHATQGTDANRPPLAATAVNGIYPIDPAGNDFLSLTAPIADLQPYTIVIVAKATTGADNLIMGRNASGNDYIYLSGLTLFRNRIGSTNLNYTINISSAYHIFTMFRDYVSPHNNSLRIDTNDIGNVANAAAFGKFDAIFKGNTLYSTEPLLEIILYSDKKSASEITQIENWLKAKYGL